MFDSNVVLFVFGCCSLKCSEKEGYTKTLNCKMKEQEYWRRMDYCIIVHCLFATKRTCSMSNARKSPSSFEFLIVPADTDKAILQIDAALVLCNLSCHRRIVCICITKREDLVIV